jgi:hypothetical protein
MKILRFLLVLAVIGYVGWLAWPILGPMVQGGVSGFADGGFDLTSMQTLLWVGAIALYLVAAVMLGSGNPKAAAAYFLGFIADAVLRLALDRRGGGGEGVSDGGVAERSIEATTMAAPAAGGIDPTWIVLGVLLLIGVLVLAVSRRRVRVRTPGHLAG